MDSDGVTRLQNMNDDERRGYLMEIFTEACTAQDMYSNALPLFERAGVKDSPELRQLVIKLGTEYLNIMCARHALQFNKHHPDIQNIFAATARKDTGLWNIHAMQEFARFPDETKAYDKGYDSPPDNGAILNAGDKRPQLRLVGSIVRLALRTFDKLMPHYTSQLVTTNTDITEIAAEWAPNVTKWPQKSRKKPDGTVVDEDPTGEIAYNLRAKARDVLQDQLDSMSGKAR